MKSRSISLFLLVFLFVVQYASAQQFINGGFETNTAGGTSRYNLTNVGFSNYITNVYSFGWSASPPPEADIIHTSTIYGTIHGGSYSLGMSGGSDSISLKLSYPLIQGYTYTLALYHYRPASYSGVSDSIFLGVSTSATTFGTTIGNHPVPSTTGTWQYVNFSFVAPGNGQYITICGKDGGPQDWFWVDDFLLTGPTTAISVQPKGDTVCAGNNISMYITADSTTANQWQVSTNNGSSWANVSNGGVYSGATNDTLNITSATISMNGYLYRCIAIAANQDTSNAVRIGVNALPTVTSTTGDTVCAGQNGVLHATASSGASIKWYDSSTGGTQLDTGTILTINSATTTRTYYAEAFTGGGGSSTTLATPYNNDNGQRGAMFDVQTSGNAITVTSFDCNLYSGTTANYEIWYRPSTFVGHENSSTGWTQLGTANNLTSLGNNVATPIPISFSVTIPANTRYSFYITNDYGGGTSYTDGTAVGNFWAGNSDVTIYEGVGKSYPFGLTFTVRKINATMHYTLGGGCTSAVRTGATLTVNPQANITVNPANSSITSGSNTSFSITATSAATYQWQVSTNSGSSWSNLGNTGIYSGATTSTLSLTGATSTQNNYQYRCIAANSGGCNDTSTGGILTISGTAPSISSPPSNSSICLGGNTSFSVTASGTSLTYQWQASTNSGSTWTNVSNTGIYGGATTATLSLTGVTSTYNNYQYRCIVTGSVSPTATSTAALLTVNSAPTISVHPSNSTIGAGSNTSFTVTATGTSLTYQWQVSTNSGSTWTNLGNTGIYSGVTTNTLNLAAVTASYNAYQYRCIVSGSCTPAANSNAATLTVNSAPAITTQPANRTICDGANTTFTVAASNAISYQWQISSNGGSTWNNLSNTGIYSGATTTTLTLTGATTSVNGYKYRCEVTGATTPNAVSNAATLTINTAPAISVHPANSTICSGANTTFSVTASGAGLTYQWQVSTNSGSTWTNVSNTGIYTNATTATLNLTAATTGQNSYQYRCIVSGTCTPSVTSNPATLLINAAPAVTVHPGNSTICSGANTSFSVTATGTGLTYQWQVSSNSGGSWSSLGNTGIYTGATTSTLSLTAATSAVDGYQYRCVVSGSCSPAANSNAATLTINTSPSITLQPANTTTCDGSNASFGVTATGAGLTYQWQVSTNSGSTWSNVTNTGIYTGATTNTLNLTGATSAVDGYQYRCIINGTCSPAVTSSAATISINSILTIGTQPANNTICSGASTTFTVAASGTGLTYQWQVSTNSGSSWSNLANSGIYSGATTGTLNLTGATTAVNNYQYRCVVSSTCSSPTNSNAATLTVNGSPAVSTQPVNSTICNGANTSFSVTATGAGLTCQWQEYDGSSWSNLTNTGIYTGTTTATLTLTGATNAVNTYQYRCVVSGTCSPAVNSNAATLTINEAPAVTLQPASTTTCDGSNASFGVTATGAGLTYQWQVSTNSGSTWNNITNTGIYTGATTNTLNLTGVTSAANNYQHRCVISGTCTPAVTSSAATLTINSTLAISTQPASSTICSGNNAAFSVTASASGLTYQWQEYNGSTWSNLTNTGIYSGVTTSALTLTAATTAVTGYQYRCVLSSTCTAPVNSNTATLTVNVAPAITNQPVNSTICEGNNTSYTIAATGAGLSYQWKVYDGSSWSNVTNAGVYTGATTNTLNITAATAALNNYAYRCVVGGSCVPGVNSDSVTLTVHTAPAITTQPVAQTICAGNNTSFSVVATGSGLTYQWEVYNGSTWSNIANTGIYSGATSDTLILTAATTAITTYQYRCKISGTCTPDVTSNAVSITVNAAPAITLQPANSTICEHTSTTFTASASGVGLTYQWQVYGGSTWSNVTNTGIYTGATTSTLTLSGATTAVHNYQYRCVVGGTCVPGVTTAAATLTINTAPAVATPPADTTVCENTNASFTVAASGIGLSYQWQLSTNAGSTWNNLSNTGIYSSATTAILSITGATTAENNYQYRCVVSGTCVPPATSAGATLHINTAPVVTIPPANSTICSGNNTSFSVSATGVGLTYQWQEYDGSTWTNLSNTGIYSGVTTATLSLTGATIAINTYQYRCMVSGTCSPATTSSAATLTINSSPAITTQPANSIICELTNTTFNVVATGAALTYQWQVNDGSGWSNVANTGIYTGATTATLSLTTATTAVDGYHYRCVIGGTCIPGTTSDSATLTINTAPVIISQPSASTICSGNNTSFGISATGTGLTYQWQVNNGGGWTNLNNTGIYSGANTDTLILTAATTAVNTYQYRCVVSGTCSPNATTTAAVLSINTAPVVTTHPANRTICENTSTTFAITATGTGLAYQWQAYDGNSWSNISNTGIYSGTTTPTLTLTNATTAVHNYHYRCSVGGTCMPGVNSNDATLVIQTAPVITMQPVNDTICNGSNVSFSITATGTGLNYQWQVSTNGGGSWSSLGNTGIYSGTNTHTLSLTAAGSSVHNYQYRCVVTGTCTPPATSTAAVLTINELPLITAQPTSQVQCEGANTVYSVTASGTGITYQWQVNTGSGWTNLSNTTLYSGATTNTLALTNVPTSINTYQYRCVVTGTCAPAAISNVAAMTVYTQPVIQSNPSDSTVCEGMSATFAVNATGSVLTYQWQVSTNGGSSWSSLGNTGLYSGATSAILSLSNIPPSYNAYRYRCIVTGYCPTAKTSTPAVLTVNTNVAINTQPAASTTICSGDNASFTVGATGTGLTYAWYMYNGSSWTAVTNTGVYSGANTPTLNITGITATSTAKTESYHCTVTGTCSAITSGTAYLTINALPAITAQPTPVSVCDSTFTIGFNIAATGTNIAYQWQVSTNGGSSWSNLSNNSTYTGVATSSLHIAQALYAMNGYKYHCVVSGTCTPDDTSTAVTLTVIPLVHPVVSIAATNTDICVGTSVTFTASQVHGGNAVYQWKKNGTNTGTNSSSYTSTTLADADVIICEMTSNATCPSPKVVNSNALTMKVTPYSTPVVTVTSSVGDSGCSGKPITFTAAPVNGGSTPQYQWQVNGSNVGSNINSYLTSVLQNGDIVSCIMTSSIKCPSPKVVNSNKMTMTITKTTLASILINANPDTIICDKTDVTMYAAFTNGGTKPAFQWILNGIDLPGETNGTLKINGIDQGDIINCRFTSNAICVFPEISNSVDFDVVQNVTPEVKVEMYQMGENSFTFRAVPVYGGSNPQFQWFINGVKQKGETGITFIPDNIKRTDRVTVQMYSNLECVTTRLVTSRNITTGIVDDKQVLTDLNLFPNPNSGKFNITAQYGTTVNADADVVVMNSLGQSIYKEKVRISNGKIEHQFDLGNNLPVGNYMLWIVVDDQKLYRQFNIMK